MTRPSVATEAGRIALKEGALVETSAAAPSALPFERDSSISSCCGTSLGTGERQSRALAAQEAARVLRPGGRCMVIDTLARSGDRGTLWRADDTAADDRRARVARDLEGSGVRRRPRAGERDGLRFVEAVKKNS